VDEGIGRTRNPWVYKGADPDGQNGNVGLKGDRMKTPSLKAIGTTTAFTTLIATGLIVGSQHGRAQSDNGEESRIQIGFAIAPVPLNLNGKNRSLVGLGSYIVNAQSDCNGCHSAGPASTFLFGGIPYFGQHPTKINPAVYLGGGDDFGTLDPGGLSAHIITRNLTPDKTGLPEGGATFEEFVPPPFDGSLLQIMPWPIYANMTDRDLRAIYEYLSAIPCLEGDPGNPAGADTQGQRCH
jgi:hypothetical protein